MILAQRVEQYAQANGVNITGAVFEALPKRLPFEFTDLGEKDAKGFDQRVRVYRIEKAAGADLPAPPDLPSKKKKSHRSRSFVSMVVVSIVLALALFMEIQLRNNNNEEQPATNVVANSQNRPHIAVLPFSNMSGDPDQRYFTDGISEDVITDLSRVSGIRVIARNSSFEYRFEEKSESEIAAELGADYVLSGSVRKHDDSVRVNVSLVDARRNIQLWAHRFDRQLTDIFSVQDEITTSIVHALSVQLTGEEQEYIESQATSDFVAYDLFLRGQQLFAQATRQSIAGAISHYRQAIERDPDFARAYGALGVATMREVLRGWSSWPAEGKERAFDMASKAVSLDPLSHEAHWSLGFVNLYRGKLDAAIEEAKRTVELAPSYSDGYGLLSLVSNWAGKSVDALRYVSLGVELNPRYTWDYPYNIGRAKYHLGEHEDADLFLRDALERNPAALPAQIFLIANYVRLNRLDDAEWEVQQLAVNNPEVTISHISDTWPFGTEEMRELVITDLRAASLPE